MVDGPPTTPVAGDQFLYSQIADATYKRLTRTITVPAGGADMSFQVNRDTEPGWDFVFVEARTAGGEDWTTLPDANGHTSQDTGACPGPFLDNPFLAHYMTDVPPDLGDPEDPDDDVYFPCEPHGTSGDWNAASGQGDGWETWTVHLPNTGGSDKQVEVSIAYVSDGSVQGQGTIIDDIAVSTGEGSTSFENDADVLDGWVAPVPKPDGGDNENTWTVTNEVAGVPALGAFDPQVVRPAAGDPRLRGRQLRSRIRSRPRAAWSTGSGRIRPREPDQADVLAHLLRAAARATTSWSSTSSPTSGSATTSRSTRGRTSGSTRDSRPTPSGCGASSEGFGTAQEIFDGLIEVPEDDFLWEMAIGDPGPIQLFDFPVYARGAMTLQALRDAGRRRRPSSRSSRNGPSGMRVGP